MAVLKREAARTAAESCKRDCRYYARSTKSCDYRLIAGKGRGCAVELCGLYERGDRSKQHLKFAE